MCCSECCGLTQHVKANPRPSATLPPCLMVILTEHTTGHKQTSHTRRRERGRGSEIIKMGGKNRGGKRESDSERVKGKSGRKAGTEKTRECFQTSQPCGSLSGGADLQQDLQIEGSAELHSLVETHTHTLRSILDHNT